MSCYKPLVAQYATEFYIDEEGITREKAVFNTKRNKDGSLERGKQKIIIASKFDDKDPMAYDLLEQRGQFLIPCGKCIGCRLDYARHWADRMTLEYVSCGKACFVTLTYKDEELPDTNPETGEFFNHKTDLNDVGAPISPLKKDDLQEFMKCLRSKFVDNGHDVKIRFFACGEYGEKRHRPHFHIILFGVDLQDMQISFSGDIKGTLEYWDMNELGQVCYRSNLLEDTWKNRGIVTVSDVSYGAMGYVARYSLKKAKGDDYADRYNLPKEFTNMSRNPGIGATFLAEHQDIVEDVDSWFFRGKQIYWPKYLVSKCIDIDEEGNIKYIDRGDNDVFLNETKQRR